ncbi:MAG: mechanosensitive ion channel family protein [Gammaproteobacteria bacterium]|nr:mechanosensitive ion channel family protein [Gammaproteobacteria bacterium]
MRTLFLIVLVLAAQLSGRLAAAPNPPAEDDKATETWAQEAAVRLKSLSSKTQAWQATPPDDKTMLAVQDDAGTIRDRAEQCVADFGARLASVQERLTALGDTEKAAAEIREVRQRFESDQKAIERQLAVCRLLSLGARDVRDAVAQLRRDMLSRELLNRGKTLWWSFSDLVVNGFAHDAKRTLGFEPWPAVAVGLLLFALMVPIALLLASMLKSHFDVPAGDEATALQRHTVLARMYGRRLPWLAGFFAVIVTLYVAGATPLAAIGAALMISAVMAPMVQLFVCQGRLRCGEGVPARLLVDLVLVAGVLLLTQAEEYIPEEATELLRAGFLLVLAVVALWLLFKLSRRNDLETLRGLRLPIALALLAGPVADWIGYHNLGEFLTLGIYGTGAGILLTWLLLSTVSDVVDQLRVSDEETQSPMRRWLGYGQGEQVPGIGIVAWLIRLLVIVGLGYWLLYSWQVSDSDTASLRDVLHEGFTVGAVHIVPSKLFVAALAFFLLLTLARWLRRQLGERWLTRTTLDSGARQSIVSLTSYTIIGVAIMLALSMAGLDFQNLAIVAGALSVGIGFGLQNIVNNFVSGLILLFERPVRPGDWVAVGGTEGYVRRISIRYTLIQTFDRADVLVPNSELISNQVTNLMLTDSLGRVIVPVGVAYGTDTRQVRDILNKVVREHPLVVVHDARVNPPRVLFMGFGDSSLDFEVRFFIRNIDYKLSVRSDILFAIDDAFREAGIEIPFPQRVVHITPPPPAAETRTANDQDDPG